MTLVSFGSSAISPKVGQHVSRTQAHPVFMGNGTLPAVLKHLAARPAMAKPVTQAAADCTPIAVMMGAGYCPAAIRHLDKQR